MQSHLPPRFNLETGMERDEDGVVLGSTRLPGSQRLHRQGDATREAGSLVGPMTAADSPSAISVFRFNAWDQNNDGQLSLQELPENLRRNFDRVDTDKNGSISKSEHQAVTARTSQNRPKTPRLPENIDAKLDLPYADTEIPRQRLDLYLPKAPKATTPLPVIVFIHGGGWKGGDKASGINNLAPYIASGHYAGISVGYRLTNEAQWPAQIHDCKAAIRWIKANAKEYNIDPAKIAVWGTSAGGHLVSFLGTSGDVKSLEGTLGKHLDQNSQVTCVINFFGPENFLTMVRQESTVDRNTADYPEALLLGGRVQDQIAAATEASPVTHVSPGDAPFLTAHGTQDPLVPYAQGQEIDAALKKAGVESLLITMTNGGHGFRSPELDQRVQQFLDLHLRNIPTTISTTPILTEPKK
jgi:acetyl esterase/lipase